MRTIGLRTILALPFVVRYLPAANGRSTVLLSFDDGPTAGVTDAVLDRLAAHGARALFCLIGERVQAEPGLTRRIAEAGHALGNHSFNHDLSAWPNPPAYLDDVDRCSQAIAEATGRRPAVFRAPGGRLHRASVLGPRELGLRHILWSVDPRDYRCHDADDGRRLGRRLADVVRGRDIVLLHDNHGAIGPLLDELLPRLTSRGIDLASGPTLLGLDEDPA